MPIRRLGMPAALLVALGAAALPEAHAGKGAPRKAAAGPGDGCDARGDSPAEQRLAKAETDLRSGDADEVRAAAVAVRKDAAADPYLLLRAGSLLERLGDKDAARATYGQADEAAIRAGGDARVVALYRGAAAIRLGDVARGKQLVDAVRAAAGAEKALACRYIAPAQAAAAAGEAAWALSLLRAVRDAQPAARSVHNALVGIALDARDDAALDEALAAATTALPSAIEFTVLRINRLKVTGKRDEALALVEKNLLAGVDDPALLGEFLGLISADAAARSLEQHWLDLAAQHPELPTMALAVGVDYHYLHDYARSSAWLKKAGALIDKEPRVAMYLAMNEFHLDHTADAEAYIERAAHAGRPDPDIYYCRAVIEVRKDPGAAMRDLGRYMALTTGRSDVEPAKQQRVQQTIDLLAACQKEKDPRACVEQQVVVKAKALAFREHYPGTDPDEKPKPAPAPAGAAPKK